MTWPAARITPFAITVKANCVFNDSAMAALAMQAEGRIRRIAILDCDVHQDNGTASILADDPTVFTFSIHGARNFRFPRNPAISTSNCRMAPVTPATWMHLNGASAMPCRLRNPNSRSMSPAPIPTGKIGSARLAPSKEGLRARDDLVLELCHAHSRAGRNRDGRRLFEEHNRYRGHPFLDRGNRRAFPSRTATACCSSPRRAAQTRPLSLIVLVFARRFASSRFEEVRPSILISKYKNFLTGSVRLLELVLMYRLGHNI